MWAWVSTNCMGQKWGEKKNFDPLNTGKEILLAPLDWGLGHATRCVPIIRALEALGCKVVLASTGRSRLFLEDAFPHLEHLDIPAYGITFSGKSVVLDISMQVPGMLKTIEKERKWLQDLLETRHFDGVISDNRYGLDAHPHSAFITHQLLPMVPAAVSRWVKRKLNSTYAQFEKRWVPDVEGAHSLAGRLSSPEKKPEGVEYVGWLSRFGGVELPSVEQDVDWLVILSGPEGQRKKSEDAVLERLRIPQGHVVVLRGLPGTTAKLPSLVESIAHPSDAQFVQLVARSKNILATAGYSTIMDLVALGRSALLMPTPGQYEQEYLAEYLANKGWFQSVARKHLHRHDLSDVTTQPPPFDSQLLWLEQWVTSL